MLQNFFLEIKLLYKQWLQLILDRRRKIQKALHSSFLHI